MCFIMKYPYTEHKEKNPRSFQEKKNRSFPGEQEKKKGICLLNMKMGSKKDNVKKHIHNSKEIISII